MVMKYTGGADKKSNHIRRCTPKQALNTPWRGSRLTALLLALRNSTHSCVVIYALCAKDSPKYFRPGKFLDILLIHCLR